MRDYPPYDAEERFANWRLYDANSIRRLIRENRYTPEQVAFFRRQLAKLGYAGTDEDVPSEQ